MICRKWACVRYKHSCKFLVVNVRMFYTRFTSYYRDYSTRTRYPGWSTLTGVQTQRQTILLYNTIWYHKWTRRTIERHSIVWHVYAQWAQVLFGNTTHTHTHTYSTFKQHQVWSKRVFIFQYCWVYLSARVILLYIKIKFNSFFNKYDLQSVSHKYTFLSYCLGIDVRRV